MKHELKRVEVHTGLGGKKNMSARYMDDLGVDGMRILRCICRK